MRVLVLQGPNLNLLGLREPDLYGVCTLEQLQARLDQLASTLGVTISHFQSNHEGALVDRVHLALREKIDWVIVNPAAYTHSSIALRDAFLATRLPFIEVHLSNVFQRESFRHRSYFSDISVGQISGLGAQGYELALHACVHQRAQRDTMS